MSETMAEANQPEIVTVTSTQSTLNRAAPGPNPPKSSVPVLMTPPITMYTVLRPQSKLNPDALPYEFETNPDKRSLYITLSHGSPLRERQIFRFFNGWFPSSVEDVRVQKTPRRKPGLFGKVTFKRADTPICVMGIHEKVCVYVDGFPLHCKWFVSKAPGESSNAANTATNTPDDE